MSAPGCTPGPWEADEYGTVNGPDGRTIELNGFASVCSPGDRMTTAYANGRQAAASPELYDALARAQQIVPLHYADWHTNARAALAKANGK